MEITIETKIADLLRVYPELEEYLIELNPKFKKLKNPILRRTVAKVASIRQAAFVGGMEPMELLNALREKKGQKSVVKAEEEAENGADKVQERPSWIGEPSAIISANKLLDEGKNPLAVASKKLKEMTSEEILVIESDFFPSPLIDEMKKNGYEVYSQAKTSNSNSIFETFILAK